MFRAWPALYETYFPSLTTSVPLPLLPAPTHVVPRIIYHLLYLGNCLLPTHQTQLMCHHLFSEDFENAPVTSIRPHAALDIGAPKLVGAPGRHGQGLTHLCPQLHLPQGLALRRAHGMSLKGPERTPNRNTCYPNMPLPPPCLDRQPGDLPCCPEPRTLVRQTYTDSSHTR